MKGFKNLNSDSAQTVLNDLGKKCEMLVHNTCEIQAHVKMLRQSGKRQLYELSVRCSWPGDTFAVHSEGWDLKAVVREAAESMENGLRHHYHKPQPIHT